MTTDAAPSEGRPPEAAPEMRACPFCAEQILRAAIKCKHCGSVIDEAAAAKISGRHQAQAEPQADAAQDSTPYEVPGVNGQVRLTKKRVIISRKGVLGFLTQGLKGDKEIPISSISAIQFKPAGALTNGYVQFTLPGGNESKGGLMAATHDENTVIFNAAQQAYYTEIKRYVDSVIDGSPVAFESLNLPRGGATPVAAPATSAPGPAVAVAAPVAATVAAPMAKPVPVAKPAYVKPANLPNVVDLKCPKCGSVRQVYPKNLSGQPHCSSCATPLDYAAHMVELTPEERAKRQAEENRKSRKNLLIALLVLPACCLFGLIGNLSDPNRRRDGGSSSSGSPAAGGQTAKVEEIASSNFYEFNNVFGVDAGTTEMNKDSEWKKWKGKYVQWAGQLEEVDDGFSGLTIHIKHLPNTLTFDTQVTLRKGQKERAASLRKGQYVTYRAKLVSRGGAVLPHGLDDGVIVD